MSDEPAQFDDERYDALDEEPPLGPGRAGAHRLHPSAIFFDLMKSVRGFLVPGLAVLFLASGDSREVWLMAMFVPVAMVQLVRYWTLRYEVRGSELILTEGLLHRNERNIPLERVQDIDTKQGPLHRLLGVASVRLRTATDGAPEAELSALSTRRIEELRSALVRARQRSGGQAPASAYDVAREEPGLADARRRPFELRLPPHALVKLALVRNRGLLALGAGFAFLAQYGILDRLKELPGFNMLEQLPEEFGELLGLGFMLATLFVLALLSPLFSIPWTLLRYGDFSLRLDGDDLRIEKGWWTRTSMTIPRARIQRVSVVESPLQRLFGVVSVHAVNAGRSGQEGSSGGAGGAAELLPILDRQLAERFLAAFVPEFAWSEVWNPPHARATYRLRRGAWIRAALLGGALAPFFGWGAAFIALVYVALADWRARRRGAWLAWQRADRRVAAREGAFVRRTIVAPLQKIQTAVQRESLFDRRWGMRHLSLDTAGGSAVRGLEFGYLPRDASATLAGALVEDIDASRFHW